MLEVLQFIFEDFWRLLGICVMLMIIGLWKPVEIKVIHYTGRVDDEKG